MVREYQSHSSITTYTLCPRKYDYQYNRGYSAAYSNVDLEYGRGFANYLEHGGPGDIDLGALNRRVLAEMYFGYTKMYPEHSSVDMRHEVSWEYEGFRGRFDAINENTGILYETKTTRRYIDDRYWNGTDYTQQGMLYLFVAQKLGYKVDRVVWDVVRRPTLKLKKAESHDEYIARVQEWIYANRASVYVRKELRPWDTTELQSNFSNMVQIAKSAARSSSYPQHKINCTAFGRLCEYYSVCFEGADLTDPEFFIRK